MLGLVIWTVQAVRTTGSAARFFKIKGLEPSRPVIKAVRLVRPERISKSLLERQEVKKITARDVRTDTRLQWI